jgi:tetratricopeptide (TPR) repeat protein
MNAQRLPIAMIGLAALAWSATAVAQDMVFTPEMTEGGGDMVIDAPPAEGPPSEAMAAGLRLYQQKAFREASVQFQRVVEGATADAEANQMKAQFFLGKSLFHLKFYQSSLAVFEEIVQAGDRHLYFKPTLEWLAQLSRELPEPAGIIGLVGQYGETPAVLVDFDTPERKETYNELLYLMGRYWYNQAQFEKSRSFLEAVDKDAKHYVHSMFFIGITYVRERQASASVKSFRKIVDKFEGTPRIFLSPEEERFLDLAWLSLARMYYTLEHWDSALESWSRIPQTSEYWLDALFEESWAYFMVGEDVKIQGYQKALGNIHTLNSPYFESAFYPESLVLRAVIYFGNCWYEEANMTVDSFMAEYQPIKDELSTELQKYEDNISFFEFLRGLKGGAEQGLSPQLRKILNTALSDRTLLRNLEYVKVLDKEEERLSKMPPEFRNASIGIRILQDIAAAKSVAIDNAGDLARNRYERLITELQDLINQAAAIQIEIINAMLGELDKELQEQQVLVATKASKKIKTDSEHNVWPFEGEYWRDELGFYRQLIDSRCGR